MRTSHNNLMQIEHTLVVDLAVAINIGLPDHLVDLVVGQLLTFTKRSIRSSENSPISTHQGWS
jgi:hypothetical protein